MVDIGQASSSKSVATLLYMRTCLMSASPPQFLPETKVEYIIYWYAERTLLSLQSQVTWPYTHASNYLQVILLNELQNGCLQSSPVPMSLVTMPCLPTLGSSA